jgi:hypothetical protein
VISNRQTILRGAKANSEVVRPFCLQMARPATNGATKSNCRWRAKTLRLFGPDDRDGAIRANHARASGYAMMNPCDSLSISLGYFENDWSLNGDVIIGDVLGTLMTMKPTLALVWQLLQAEVTFSKALTNFVLLFASMASCTS